MRNRKIHILFNVFADAGSYNAQSLNAREIALRLDRDRFHSTFFLERFADTRLEGAGVRLVRMPQKRRTIRVFGEMLGRFDLIMYMDPSPASYTYLHLPRFMRRSTRTIFCMEGPRGNFEGVSPTVVKYAFYVARHSDGRTAVSEFVARDARNYGGVQTDAIIPPGVDTKVFHPPGSREHAVPTVLFVGHLIERKGAQFVVEAAERLPEVRFRLIGSPRGSFGEDLQKKCKSLSNVSAELPRPQSQLAEVMRECDVMLHPSRVEGVPKVTLEAAATGLPCVVFDDYKSPSVVDGATGYQVKTTEEMLARLNMLIADRSLRERMGTAAVIHAREFDWDKIAAKWTEFFERLAA